MRASSIAITAAVIFLDSGGGAAQHAPGERRFTIFYSGEVHGTLEPCGCTSDPLGDVARYAALVRATARSTPVMLVDGGGLSFPETSSPKERAADALRAKFLAKTLPALGPFAAGLSETDLRGGPADVAPRRLAVNVGDPPVIAPSLLQTIGGVRVGVLGVADPALADKLGPHAKVDDPVGAAKREVERLRRAGAEVVVALAPVDKSVARRLARAAAPDIIVLGRQVGEGQPRAEQVGSSFLVAGAEELERVGRLDFVLRGAGPLSDAGGPAAASLRRQEIDEAIARLDDQLKSWAASRGGDPGFVAAKRRERDALAAERKQLDAPWAAPATGNYFINELIPLRRSLPRDEAVAAAMRRLDREMAAINLRHASPPPPAEPGRAYYVGDAKCATCHQDALAFWTSTVHATAWRTLVAIGKQNDYRCTGCHVTGYGQVGGSSLGHTEKLRDVQCEVCHGPGSIHVAEKGLEEPASVRRDVPASTCTGCHTEQHSDTFQYEAYLRDILGPGHGGTERQKLGDGPTGHELRSAALSRAKSAGSAEAKSL